MTIHTIAELATRPELTAPPTLLVPPCAVRGRVGLVALGPKGGKSTTLAGMLTAGSLAGVTGCLITIDEAKADSLQRLIRFGAEPDAVYLTDTFDADTLAQDIVEHGVEFLGVDHLGKLAEMHPDFKPNSQGDPILWGRLIAPFTKLARDLDIAVLILDQARRSDGKYSGSAAKAGSVDFVAELIEKDGGLEAAPRGRIYLPKFRVELDPNGCPVFIDHSGAPTTTTSSADLTDTAMTILRALADAEPEGLTSSGWRRITDLPETTYHRARRKLLREGLALDPSTTRTRRYRITDRGEQALGATTAMAVPRQPLTPATHAKQIEDLLAVGSVPLAVPHLPQVPRQYRGSNGSNPDEDLERLAIQEEVAE